METQFRATRVKMFFTAYVNGVDKRLIAKKPKKWTILAPNSEVMLTLCLNFYASASFGVHFMH